MTRTVVRVQPQTGGKKGKGEEGADAGEEEGGEGAEGGVGSGGGGGGGSMEQEGDGGGGGGDGAFGGLPPCTQEMLLEQERAMERELQSADSALVWANEKGKTIGTSEYREVGLSKIDAVCAWLDEQFQVGGKGDARIYTRIGDRLSCTVGGLLQRALITTATHPHTRTHEHPPQDGWLDAGVAGEGPTAVVDPNPSKYVLFAHHLSVLDSLQAAVQEALKK